MRSSGFGLNPRPPLMDAIINLEPDGVNEPDRQHYRTADQRLRNVYFTKKPGPPIRARQLEKKDMWTLNEGFAVSKSNGVIPKPREADIWAYAILLDIELDASEQMRDFNIILNVGENCADPRPWRESPRVLVDIIRLEREGDESMVGSEK